MNQSWMDGYTSDIEYTSGYYREQEPEFINFSAVMHGVEPINLDKSFTYCELGCGLGMTSLIMAANYPQGNFVAVDYNPSHISYASRIAEEAGLTNIIFQELSFEEIAEDPSLIPQCDFISFHGIYTWVNDANRDHLVTICKNNLKSGGLVYNSYNAQPGWAAVSPLQKVLNSLSQSFTGTNLQKLSASVDYINEFRELKPRYFELNSDVLQARLDNIKDSDPSYLVHEYLHEGWQAFHFTDVAEKMSSAKLSYVGLSNPAEAYAYSIMPEKLREMLAKLPDIQVREMIKDLAYNTSFRKDLYSRGARKINKEKQIKWLENKKWMLLADADKQTFKFALSVGEATGKEETYQAVIDALKDKPLSTAELQETTEIPMSNLIQILVFMLSGNKIAFKCNQSGSNNLNKAIAESDFVSKGNHAFSAQNIGTALFLNPIERAFLKSYLADESEDNFTDEIYEELSSKGLNLTEDGNTYVGDAMKEHLIEMEISWREKVLPKWKKLGVV